MKSHSKVKVAFMTWCLRRGAENLLLMISFLLIIYNVHCGLTAKVISSGNTLPSPCQRLRLASPISNNKLNSEKLSCKNEPMDSLICSDSFSDDTGPELVSKRARVDIRSGLVRKVAFDDIIAMTKIDLEFDNLNKILQEVHDGKVSIESNGNVDYDWFISVSQAGINDISVHIMLQSFGNISLVLYVLSTISVQKEINKLHIIIDDVIFEAASRGDTHRLQMLFDLSEAIGKSCTISCVRILKNYNGSGSGVITILAKYSWEKDLKFVVHLQDLIKNLVLRGNTVGIRNLVREWGDFGFNAISFPKIFINAISETWENVPVAISELIDGILQMKLAACACAEIIKAAIVTNKPVLLLMIVLEMGKKISGVVGKSDRLLVKKVAEKPFDCEFGELISPRESLLVIRSFLDYRLTNETILALTTDHRILKILII